MALIHLLPLFLTGPVVARAPDVAESVVATVSTGESFNVKKSLFAEHPTILVFYQETSSADKEFADGIKEQLGDKGAVGLRFVRLKNLDAPAAKDFEIRETPTMIVYDRFGNTLVRTSKIEEVVPAMGKALRMARIKWVDEHDAEAEKTYRMIGGGKQPVAGILKTMSLRPDLMEEIAKLSEMAHFRDGFLPRKTKEMIATYVSGLNRCPY